jgi:hypothetical protein
MTPKQHFKEKYVQHLISLRNSGGWVNLLAKAEEDQVRAANLQVLKRFQQSLTD